MLPDCGTLDVFWWLKKHILQALRRFMTHLVSTILVLGPCDFKLDLELQTWIYEKSGWIWSTTKHFHEKLGQKIALIGQTIAQIGEKMPQLMFFRFLIFFCSSNPGVHVFFGNSNHAWIILYTYYMPITMSQNEFEYEVTVWMETSQI